MVTDCSLRPKNRTSETSWTALGKVAVLAVETSPSPLLGRKKCTSGEKYNRIILIVNWSHYHQLGFLHICGLDEAGRGPWAGPVYAAAVILPQHHAIQGLADSKQLSATVREYLFKKIIQKATSYAVVSISNKQIDATNILRATKRAMQKAVKKLSVQPDFLLIDALNLNIPEIPQLNLIRGDSRSESIAAASILAKVSRDHYMIKMHEKYPQYNFRSNKGYGTKEHHKALVQYGPCPLHRVSFMPVKKVA